MFVNEDFSNYKYLVEVSDNYVCLSNSSFVEGDYLQPDEVSVIYQFFYPSTQVIESSYTSYNTRTFTNVSSQISHDFYDRPDCSNIIFTGGLFLIYALFVLSLVTSFIRKGGLLSG